MAKKRGGEKSSSSKAKKAVSSSKEPAASPPKQKQGEKRPKSRKSSDSKRKKEDKDKTKADSGGAKESKEQAKAEDAKAAVETTQPAEEKRGFFGGLFGGRKKEPSADDKGKGEKGEDKAEGEKAEDKTEGAKDSGKDGEKKEGSKEEKKAESTQDKKEDTHTSEETEKLHSQIESLKKESILDAEKDKDDSGDDQPKVKIDEHIKSKLRNIAAGAQSPSSQPLSDKDPDKRSEAKPSAKLVLLEEYDFQCNDIPVTIRIGTKEGEFVPLYEISIANISINTEIILESIKKELIKEVNLGMVDFLDREKSSYIEEKFSKTINLLITKYFPYSDDKTIQFLTSYLIQKSLGMGKVEILMSDPGLEEIVINSAKEPVWVYHRRHGWLKTNVVLSNEDQTRHYSTMIGRKIGRQINILNPLLDASLQTGDRVNATLMPISNFGNTITIRKFAARPWTITDLLTTNTMNVQAASMIWLALQYELSALIAGGTGSGKTSTLNVISSFFPPNQRVISIEDTREIRLPKYLHWVPMMTRPPNSEGKGEISMEHLLVNSLRQRPDRIIVGEIRRKREAEVLFEAMHTGHSTYATVHANTAEETITRLTNPPIDIPKTMLPALSLIIVQFRNRRMNVRRTLQLAEITKDSDANVLL
ncbi:hypothetical protein DRJ25_04015, partial [Candidatus Woesearchaeota archaeon]